MNGDASHRAKSFLSVREFCSETGLAKNTVYAGIREGRIPSVNFARRKTLIPREALQAATAGKPEGVTK